MLISSRYRFIFIHIYKTAGTSVKGALRPFALPRWQQAGNRVLGKLGGLPQFGRQHMPPHIKADQLSDEIGADVFRSFFSFAFVRNPWDWQVSLYTYMLQTPDHFQHELAQGFGSFDRYIEWRCANEAVLQREFVYDRNGKCLVDFVGRFERVNDDFAFICSKIGISCSLPKLNVSNTRPYQEFYNEETRERVRRTFDADITTFGYDFEGNVRSATNPRSATASSADSAANESVIATR